MRFFSHLWLKTRMDIAYRLQGGCVTDLPPLALPIILPQVHG
jgi:hypothetical protein